jgi:hypothetical protein
MEKKEDVIELYELWTKIKARLGIISPQPKHFSLRKEVIPVTSIDGVTLDMIDLSDDTSIAAAGFQTLSLQPPKGTIYEVMDLYYAAPDPVGSAAGSHRIYIGWANLSGLYLARLVAAFGNAISIRTDIGFTANTSESPSNVREQLLVFRGVFCSNAQPLNCYYLNSTDVAQAGTRTLEVMVKKHPEGAF